MDQYIRRLRQELLSMKEVGEDLQEQMNSMMGALQELKLLQVQSALEQLDISEERNPVYNTEQNFFCRNKRKPSEIRHHSRQQSEKPRAGGSGLDNSYLVSRQRSRTANSINCAPVTGTKQGYQVLSPQTKETEIRRPFSSSVLAAGETWHANTSQITAMDASNVLPDQESSIDATVSAEAKDWTSSLMSQSRNRQPLVLGDNIFADLVGNWLDLPELEKKGEQNNSILNVSRSQEIYKKISLTANFFKKFLRSVRPDRDKLLKEKPGWLQANEQAVPIPKRSKKSSRQKGVFYFSSQADIKGSSGRVEKRSKKEGTPRMCSKQLQTPEDHVHIGFDMNSAVWV
ncbi:PAK4-inhibitor INKA2 [Bombina bombina]|uniref:PAK4-inhibitor INKA2 n=1 Tax=Bombina bombina TaxID=8345 RepID=UPI00235ADF72|nr:PAK4-inhibitor INKA2 [Bombina bombina]